MTGDAPGSPITRTWTDSSCGTGDRLLRTADGTIWKESLAPVYCGRGQVRGVIRDGKIVQP